MIITVANGQCWLGISSAVVSLARKGHMFRISIIVNVNSGFLERVYKVHPGIAMARTEIAHVFQLRGKTCTAFFLDNAKKMRGPGGVRCQWEKRAPKGAKEGTRLFSRILFEPE